MYELTEEQILGLIDLLESFDGIAADVAVMFLKSVLNGDV